MRSVSGENTASMLPRGEAGEARRDSGESKNGNPALGLSPPYYLIWPLASKE